MADAEETLKEETQAEAEATAAQASLEEMAGQLVPQAAAAEPPNPMVAAAPETCTCRYCKGEFPCSECHQYPSTTNPFRRWACRPCHNTQSTLKRHGISAEELCAGEGLDKYFSQLRREREELKKTDGLLTYARLRAQLKHHLVTERVESFESSTEGEYQPLSYWELKGYDVEKIQAQAARRDNPLLGVTYRVAIDKDKHAEIVKETERKLVEMENQIHQKKKKQLEPAVAAKALQDVGFVPGVPVEVEDSDPGLSQDPEEDRGGKGGSSREQEEAEESRETGQGRVGCGCESAAGTGESLGEVGSGLGQSRRGAPTVSGPGAGDGGEGNDRGPQVRAGASTEKTAGCGQGQGSPYRGLPVDLGERPEPEDPSRQQCHPIRAKVSERAAAAASCKGCPQGRGEGESQGQSPGRSLSMVLAIVDFFHAPVLSQWQRGMQM